MIEFDVETTGFQWYAHDLFLVSFLADEGQAVVLRHPEQREEIQEWLSRDDDYRAWNSKFDLHFLEAAGYTLPPSERWHDGMVSAHLLDEQKSVALKARGAALFGEGERDQEKSIKDWLKKENKRRKDASKETGEKFVGANYSDVPDELMIPYAGQDVILTRRVGEIQDMAVANSPELSYLYGLEMEVMGALYDAEREGFPIDEPYVRRLEMVLAEDLDHLHEQAVDLAGIRTFNPRSSQQLYEALKRRGADLSFVTNESMDKENLATVNDELARLIESYRATHKLLTTYVQPMLHGKREPSLFAEKAPFIHDGRIHTNYRQVGALTGRMSSADPNLQNLPRDDLRLRHAFKADPGYKLVTADLSNVELVLFAAYAGEGRLMEAILRGEDMHTMTADFVGLTDFIRAGGHIEPKRQRGKTFNYSIVYGAGQRSVRKAFLVSQKEAKAMIERYHKAYPEVGKLQRQITYKLHDQGYIRSAYGRRYRVAPRDSYKAVNYLVQGTAADMLKISIARLRKEGVPIIAAVHDELIAHVPEKDAPEVARLIEAAMVDHPKITERVPLEAEAQIVDRWSQAKKADYIPEFEQERQAA